MEYGNKLNSERSLRTAKGIKGTRQKVIVTHNPSKIGQNQQLLVKFPNLASDDVIVPGTVNLSFNIELGRAIVQKLAVKFERNEILCIDDFDIFVCYRDLSETKSEKINAVRQGIISIDGYTENCMKFRINAADKTAGNAKDIADTYENKFIIPLDFEMLESVMLYYQVGLGNRLCYEITTNYYNQVINSTVASPDATYKITDIPLEFVTQSNLVRHISDKCQSMVLLYDRVIRQKQIVVSKKDTIWNWTLNTPCKSLKGILVLFEEEKPYERDMSKFYNPRIQNVSVIMEGKPNQLSIQGMRSFEQYDEAHKYLTERKAKGQQRE